MKNIESQPVIETSPAEGGAVATASRQDLLLTGIAFTLLAVLSVGVMLPLIQAPERIGLSAPSPIEAPSEKVDATELTDVLTNAGSRDFPRPAVQPLYEEVVIPLVASEVTTEKVLSATTPGQG
ncbi:MAG: hypothetical protein AAF533_30675 [Acidobacteriota bacterium]